MYWSVHRYTEQALVCYMHAVFAVVIYTGVYKAILVEHMWFDSFCRIVGCGIPEYAGVFCDAWQ